MFLFILPVPLRAARAGPIYSGTLLTSPLAESQFAEVASLCLITLERVFSYSHHHFNFLHRTWLHLPRFTLWALLGSSPCSSLKSPKVRHHQWSIFYRRALGPEASPLLKLSGCRSSPGARRRQGGGNRLWQDELGGRGGREAHHIDKQRDRGLSTPPPPTHPCFGLYQERRQAGREPKW
ncbi:hypothetical protein SAY87_014165 [Trapa incisa]|uniref:Secreted protein n=1 Tax=Trapa incisa TaxID=236973 RepID=A0AAN7JK49_9MYRT|nr:hypothetical protein SAY87_014165 [Trapa incisa]